MWEEADFSVLHKALDLLVPVVGTPWREVTGSFFVSSLNPTGNNLVHVELGENMSKLSILPSY